MVLGDGLEKREGPSMGTGSQGIDQSAPRTTSDGRLCETTRSSVERYEPPVVGTLISIADHWRPALSERDDILSDDAAVHDREVEVEEKGGRARGIEPPKHPISGHSDVTMTKGEE